MASARRESAERAWEEREGSEGGSTAPSEGVTAEARGPGRPQTEGRAGDVHAELTLRRMTLQANADDANAKPFHA